MKKAHILILIIVSFMVLAPATISGEEVPLTNRTFRNIIQNSLSSVVCIHGVVVPDEHPQRRMFPEDNFFGFPFEELFRGFPRPQPQPRTTLGTGIIISPDGYIVTNLHVIDGVKESDIKIEFHDGRIFEKGAVEIIGKDESTDLAVLKIPGEDLSHLKFGDSDTVEPGDFVVALGNPFGQLHSASLGIVSATGRQLRDIGGRKGVSIEFQDFIQTDAAINPGNSGGPLLDIHGKVIGVNNIISTTSGGNIGLGYAIAGNVVENVTRNLIEHGKVERGWIGVTIQEIDHELKEFYQIDKGVLVTDVVTDGPADKAGVSRDEVIISVEGRKVNTTRELVNAISMTPPGTEIIVSVIDREGDTKDYSIITGTRPSREDLLAGRHVMPDKILGLELQELTSDLREEMDLSPHIDGVIITSVDPASDAYQKGIRRGDIIMEINRRQVTSIEEVKEILEEVKGQPRLLLVIHRDGSNLYIVISNV